MECRPASVSFRGGPALCYLTRRNPLGVSPVQRRKARWKVLGCEKTLRYETSRMATGSELGFVTPSGRRLEGEGVAPDKAVAVTLKDFQAGRDAALEEADAYLGGLRGGRK